MPKVPVGENKIWRYLLIDEWGQLTFTVPAMSVDVYTKNKVTGKRVKKTDKQGRVVSTSKIIPKERPRFSVKKVKAKGGEKFVGHVRSGERTVDFESWIRKKFFEKYPGNCGVYVKKKAVAVHSVYLGCRWYGEDSPCTRYRKGADFLDCQVCRYRRKNLGLSLRVFLKDERHLDLDNVVKVVLDALEKVCFYNDSQFVRKQVDLFPNAESERLEVTVSVIPTGFSQGSLVGAYTINRLSVDEASDYINKLYSVCALPIMGDSFKDFLRYLGRCDERKYIGPLVESLLKKDGPFDDEYLDAAAKSFVYFINTPESKQMTKGLYNG